MNVRGSNYFSTMGSIFHYNYKYWVRKNLSLYTLDELKTFKLNWNDAHEYCQKMEMQVPTLKTLNELLEVAKNLKKPNLFDGELG
jgi:hypothetical protein